MGEKNSDEVSTVELYANQRVIISRLDTSDKVQAANHLENRNSIHDFRAALQEVCDEVWKLKIKIAGYASIAGVVTAIAIHYVEKLLTK